MYVLQAVKCTSEKNNILGLSCPSRSEMPPTPKSGEQPLQMAPMDVAPSKHTTASGLLIRTPATTSPFPIPAALRAFAHLATSLDSCYEGKRSPHCQKGVVAQNAFEFFYTSTKINTTLPVIRSVGSSGCSLSQITYSESSGGGRIFLAKFNSYPSNQDAPLEDELDAGGGI